ncbi:lysophospholipid acyltransferase family protein [Hydrogenophilus thiooxidans]|uniref:lysophospholipid acyltransferase family protein n=1 Tax=Hydrogenophilus thiooxidans TaxID=2820326 RepID=UPI001C24EB88|nr:lysophospholipid acyltransferase family protein [Hydrogenophilus thiooxidans]
MIAPHRSTPTPSRYRLASAPTSATLDRFEPCLGKALPPLTFENATTTRRYRTAWWCKLRLFGWLLLGLLATITLFPWLRPSQRARFRSFWARRILAALDVELVITGAVDPGALVVANHISWLDIPVLMAVAPMRFVAKSEVRRWPVLGWLAAQHGTIFLARGSKHHAATIGKTLTAALQNGETVALFPEGTTTDGTTLRSFHSALLSSAVHANAPVQPVALSYHRADGTPTTAAAFVGAMTFWDTLENLLAARPLTARVQLLSPLTGNDRKTLTRNAEQAIRAALAHAQEEAA